MVAAPARYAPLTRRGPHVHVRAGELWQQRRAFILLRPAQCCLCGQRMDRSETAIRLTDHGLACGDCLPHHVRGEGGCLLCRRLCEQGPRCRRCGGTGYGEMD